MPPWELNWVQSTPLSRDASASRRPDCICCTASGLKRPLQLVVPYGLPVQLPGVPVYATSFWLNATNPKLFPVMVMSGALPSRVVNCS